MISSVSAAQTTSMLGAVASRGPASDAERRAAVDLRNELVGEGHNAGLETFWCWPNRPLAQSWHALLAVGGSLAATGSRLFGLVLILLALAATIADELTGISPGRLLTRRRASQNLVAGQGPDTDVQQNPAPDEAAAGAGTTRLLVTAALDTRRQGLVAGRPTRWGRIAAARLPLSPIGSMAVAMLALLVVVALRAGGPTTFLRVMQFLLTAGLLLAAAALLDLGLGAPEGDPAADRAVAVAVSLYRALAAAPHPLMSVELLLQGAAEGQALGLRRHLRSPAAGFVLGIARHDGTPVGWAEREGALVTLPLRPEVRALCARAAGSADPVAPPFPIRACSPIGPARLRGIPAACVVAGESSDPELSASAALELALLIVEELGAHLALRPA